MSVMAETGIIGGIAAKFRTCPATGLKIDLAAERLIKANAVAAIVFLAIGGVFGLLVALTRWPAVHLLSSDMFYLVLTAHGLDVLLVWIIFFEIAVLYFASAILLNCRLATPRLAWLSFALMMIGALLANVTVLQGEASVMFTSYVPMKAPPNFYLGLILFAVGALLGCFIFLGTLVIAREERTYEGSIPLVTFGALDRLHHRHLHHCQRRDHPDPDLVVGSGLHRPYRYGDVQARMVGHGSFVPADQHGRSSRDLVRDPGHTARRQAAFGKGQPHGAS